MIFFPVFFPDEKSSYLQQIPSLAELINSELHVIFLDKRMNVLTCKLFWKHSNFSTNWTEYCIIVQINRTKWYDQSSKSLTRNFIRVNDHLDSFLYLITFLPFLCFTPSLRKTSRYFRWPRDFLNFATVDLIVYSLSTKG